MPKTGHMTFSCIYSRGLITCIIIIASLSVKAQFGKHAPELPIISRVCLWNGDRATWKKIGLNRPQIARLNQLRLLYPAVVDGQWLHIDEEVAPVPDFQYRGHGGSNIGVTGTVRGATSENGDGPRIPATTVRPEGLQEDLREVLTPAQLRSWALLCAH